MNSKVLTHYTYLTVLLCSFIICSNLPTLTAQPSFSSLLLNEVVKDKSTENVVFSSLSAEICLALAYIGAGGSTAEELKNVVQLKGDTKIDVAKNYKQILEKQSTDVFELKIANRIYVGQQYQLATEFNEIAINYFNASAVNVDFSQAQQTAQEINTWVEDQTANKIKNIISPDSISSDTAAILLNAIYFKANWKNLFDKRNTRKQNFYLSETNKVEVDMMYQKNKLLYGDLWDLASVALEMPYEAGNTSDLAMLVILPNDINGLAVLEEKLKDIDLIKLCEENCYKENVEVSIPKFKLEFDISLQTALEQLGIRSMFSNSANFSDLLSDNQNLKVAEVKQKAFIEVDETGTEAAAATSVSIQTRAMPLKPSSFVADHPFFFAIKDNQDVYFAGHVAKF